MWFHEGLGVVGGAEGGKEEGATTLITTVLDTNAINTYLEGEEGKDAVVSILEEAVEKDRPCLLSIINWGELLYIVERKKGWAGVSVLEADLSPLPIRIIPVDEAQVRQAAHYKAKYTMSYADAFAAALAKKHKARLVTGDPEFKPLEREIKIVWI
jgi:ribonuclease VapC